MLAELKNITKSYEQEGNPHRRLVLNDICLSIGPGETVAITGPSGSGKSTLLNILGMLDKPTAGQVILDGKDASRLPDQQIATLRNRFTGFVFQLHHLLPQLTLLENVLLPLLPVKDPVVKQANMEHARNLIVRLGLEPHVNRRPSAMSVGECQRVALARALVNKPRLLLADEPTGSLDAENAGHLGELLTDLNREYNLALVVVTHSAELASRMHRLYRLTSGKLNSMTPPGTT